MYVDYVRFFQKESYDENVTKPEKVFNMREADETGNFVHNGDFAEAEDLLDEEEWRFLLFNDGEGEARIEDGEIIITTTAEGTEDYSVQLVQAEMPMYEGASYKLTFDAYADEERTMKVAVTAPNNNWIRYLNDTRVSLTPEKKTYEYEFDMLSGDDDFGRVEFNMGNADSMATIHITNVRLEKVE